MTTGLWLILACGDSTTDKEPVEQTVQQTTPTTTQKSQQQNRPIQPSLNKYKTKRSPHWTRQALVPVKISPTLGKRLLLSLHKRIWDQNLLTVLTMTVMDL